MSGLGGRVAAFAGVVNIQLRGVGRRTERNRAAPVCGVHSAYREKNALFLVSRIKAQRNRPVILGKVVGAYIRSVPLDGAPVGGGRMHRVGRRITSTCYFVRTA